MKIKFLLMLTMFCTSLIANETVQKLKHTVEFIAQLLDSPAVSTATLKINCDVLKQNISVLDPANDRGMEKFFKENKPTMTKEQSAYFEQQLIFAQSISKELFPFLENARSLVKKIEYELLAREVTPIALLTLAKTPTS